MAVIVAYLIFLPVAGLCFRRLPLRVAILVTLLGGWLLLPVGQYPPGAPGIGLPWWIVGTALPSDMLLTKAWIVPLVALAGAAIGRFDTIAGWRPSIIDLPMASWCLWPLVAGLLSSDPDPAPWLAMLYVTGTWGLPWLIGRIWFADRAGGLVVTQGLAVSGLACLPVAIVEGIRPAMLYGLLYGDHPFRFDGVDRYVGHRPLGFLEHGNLYGLWTALCALAAIWLALRYKRSGMWIALAMANTIVALASQSVGAILLLFLGMAILLAWRVSFVLPAIAIAAAGLLVLAAVHLSGVVPLQSLARQAAGQQAIAALRAVGRGSFLWRVSQDSRTLGAVAAAPLRGTARWDWWRRYGTRPWGQTMLLIGQFGLIGLALAWGSLAMAAGAALLRSTDRRGADMTLPLGIVVLLTLADAMLNAFFFAPAILAAGAIAARPMPRTPPPPHMDIL